jgi:hypothetical protein
MRFYADGTNDGTKPKELCMNESVLTNDGASCCPRF